MAWATAQGVEARVAEGRMLRGWALAMPGEAAEGVAQLQQGWAVHQRVGTKQLQTYCLSLLAEAYGQAGEPEVGLEVLAEAVRLLTTTEERWWEAEVYRLQAVLRLQLHSPQVSEAEAWLRRALDVSRSQQAKALELRAAVNSQPPVAAPGHSATRPGNCWRPSMAGSPRALTRPICGRPRRCSTNDRERCRLPCRCLGLGRSARLAATPLMNSC